MITCSSSRMLFNGRMKRLSVEGMQKRCLEQQMSQLEEEMAGLIDADKEDTDVGEEAGEEACPAK
jgi:hypothetical protein